tara:strand:+ start:1309 stop:1464 length:156 start_codon:yes stop_codon:yes gene_type:complete
MAITNTIPIIIGPYELEKPVYTTHGGVAEIRKPPQTRELLSSLVLGKKERL